jgi:hypothetical protein
LVAAHAIAGAATTGAPDGVEVGQITDDDLGSMVLETVGPSVLFVNQRSDGQPPFQEQLRRRATSSAGGARNEDGGSHMRSASQRDK